MDGFIGVISDTHGLVRPQALAALKGAERILHAGDIDRPGVLEQLREIAPVIPVRGNNDRGEWARAIPPTEAVPVGDKLVYMLHDLYDLDLDPAAAGFAAVISGHSHKPALFEREGVLYLNPGSAGPRRFKLPVSVARLYLRNGRLHGELLELRVPP